MEKELTPKQQTSESIRQADSILILTGQHPTVDQVASVVALSTVLRKFGKKVSAVISDEIPAGAKFLPTNLVEKQLGGLRDFIMRVDLSRAEVDKLKYTIEDGKLNVHVTPFSGAFKSSDVSFDYGDYQFDLVIVLGVASYSRIDKVYGQNAHLLEDIPLVNIDFHRINEQYGAINLIEPYAAGLGEILVALSESLQTGLIDSEIATVILTGIMASTDRFTANHTTSKALTVAAQMMANGADQKQVVRGLYGGSAGAKKGARSDRQPERSTSQEPARQQSTQPARNIPQSQSQPRPQVDTKPVESKPAIEAAAPSAAQHQAEVEMGGTIRERAIFIQTQPDGMLEIKAPLDGDDIQTPKPAVAAPEATPKVEPMNLKTAAPLAGVPHEFETDGPAITDPDDEPVQALQSRDEDQPEPLINDEAPREQMPKPQPSQTPKRSNPTNNPIFANRLS